MTVSERTRLSAIEHGGSSSQSRHLGYLQYDARARTYIPTDRVSLLGSWINPPLFEDGALLRMMRAIQSRTGQLVLIGARNGDFAQYVHVLKRPEAVEHHIQTGMKRPIATSGVGQVLLSSMTDAEVKRLVHRMNAYATEIGDKVDVAELLTWPHARPPARICVLQEQGRGELRHDRHQAPVRTDVAPSGDRHRRLRGHTLEARETELVSIAREEMAHYLAKQRADDENGFKLRVVSDQPLAQRA